MNAKPALTIGELQKIRRLQQVMMGAIEDDYRGLDPRPSHQELLVVLQAIYEQWDEQLSVELIDLSG